MLACISDAAQAEAGMQVLTWNSQAVFILMLGAGRS